jgi:membrane fusion protein (multidrug efflux system)
LQTRDLQQRIELTGTILPAEDVTVSARVDGRVTSVPVHLGDPVKAQQTIADFDDAHLKAALAVSDAMVDSANVQLRISQSRLEYPEKNVEYIRRMSKKSFATPLDVDQSETNLEIAKANVELSEFRLQQAMSENQRSQLAIDNSRITAPFAGLVAHRFVNPGDFVRAGVPLLRVVDISTVIAAVHVVERDYASIAISQVAEIRADALSAETFEGEVIRISPVLDVQTRTAVVHLRIGNPKGRLKPGMHARVSIIMSGKANAQVLPISSLIERGGPPAVFVLVGEPPIAEKRTVSVGHLDDEHVEILSGVSPEDRIVTLGSHLVADGQAVDAANGDTMQKVFE